MIFLPDPKTKKGPTWSQILDWAAFQPEWQQVSEETPIPKPLDAPKLIQTVQFTRKLLLTRIFQYNWRLYQLADLQLEIEKLEQEAKECREKGFDNYQSIQ